MKKINEGSILAPHEFEAAGQEGVIVLDEQSAEDGLREAMDTSRRGAPSAGEAVSDIFSTDEIFHRLMATADEEFSRSSRLLFLSGLAAGLSIGLTFLARATLYGLLPEDATGLLGNLLYPIGFLFIVLGRYQLFTENTLTPVTLVLTRLASMPRLLKIWGLVYAANVLGAGIAAFLFSSTDVFEPATAAAAYGFGEHAMELGWSTLFFKGIIAGWMVAGMMWLTHAVRDAMARFSLVYLIMYLVPSVGLFHCVIGACEIAYFVFEGGTSLGDALLHFQAPVTLGNTVGGVLFVALPNYFQTRDERFREWERLSWKQWLWGDHKARGPNSSRVAGPHAQAALLLLVLVLPLAACGFDAEERPEATTVYAVPNPRSDIRALQEQSQARWQAAGIDDYQFTFRRRVKNSTESTGPINVVVRDGRIASAKPVSGLGKIDPAKEKLMGIDSLFAFLQQRINEDIDSLTIRYDAALGFPYFAFLLKEHAPGSSTEITLEVRDFVRLGVAGEWEAPADSTSANRP